MPVPIKEHDCGIHLFDASSIYNSCYNICPSNFVCMHGQILKRVTPTSI